jgi:cytochrome c-type biogenesis protein CcmH/NrfF
VNRQRATWRRRFVQLALSSVVAVSSALGVSAISAGSLGAQDAAGQPSPAGSAGTVPVAGVDPAFDERVKAVATRLRCPVCQGESIQDSPAELSTQMKTLVREQLYNGQSEEQVLGYFVEKYGQWILLEPRAEGINLLVYWLPVAFLVLGAGVIVLVVKKWTRPLPLATVDAVSVDDAQR